jgi:hypothetical protein
MNKKTMSLALTALVSLAPLGHARGMHGFGGGGPAFRGGFSAAPRATAPVQQRAVRMETRGPSASRKWDRRQVYYSGGRCYRWINGSWVLFDVGLYPFDANYIYSYDDDSGNAVYTDSFERGEPSYPLLAQVQRALVKAGYYRGPVNGRFGPAMQTAITRYQRDHRLAATGTIGQSLLASLHIS